MSKRQFILHKGYKIKLDLHQFPDGLRQISLGCMDKYCPHGCVMSFKMPAGLSSVKIGECVERLCSHCKEMVKMDEAIAKQDGRINLMSLVRREAS